MDEDDDEGVVDREGGSGGETGREPLDENEEDVFHDDKERPETGDLERLREVEKISPVFPSVAPELHDLRRNCFSGDEIQLPECCPRETLRVDAVLHLEVEEEGED